MTVIFLFDKIIEKYKLIAFENILLYKCYYLKSNINLYTSQFTFYVTYVCYVATCPLVKLKHNNYRCCVLVIQYRIQRHH